MKTLFSLVSKHPRSTMIVAISWTILIFIGCSMPGSLLPPVQLFTHFDKVVHLAFFFIFYLLWNLSFSPSTKMTLVLMVISVTYGFGIECYQLVYVKGRSFDVYDGLADSIGALLGWLCIKLYR